MYEDYHYKGLFNFMFYPTNQSKITKKYLKKIFPNEAIKDSKKVLKKLENFNAYKFLNENQSELLLPLKFYRTELLIDHLSNMYKSKPEMISIFYILLNDVMGMVQYQRDFNIEDELAQNILIQTCDEMKLFEEQTKPD